MEYWEFLLQQEGDRTWLPLESPNVEILEGRYRIVARSSRINTNVEIRISHEAIDEVPPKRRIQKRVGRTNREGLMVVIPYTRLQAGMWQLSCLGDVMSDFMGDNWKYTVNLQVLPSEAEMEEWESPWHPLEDSDEDAAEFKLSQDSSAAVLGTASRLSQTAPTMPIVSTHEVSADETAPSETIAAALNEVEGTPPLESDESTLPIDSLPHVDDSHFALPLETDPQSLTEVDPDLGQAIGASMEQFLDVAEQMSQQLVNQVFQAFDQETGLNTTPSTQDLPPDRALSDLDMPDHVLDLAATSAGLSIPTSLNPQADFADREADLSPPNVENTDSEKSDSGVASWQAEEPSAVELSAPVVVPGRSLSLSLDQPAYITQRGQTLWLSGEIREADPLANKISSAPSDLLWAELRVILQDPQSSEQLIEIKQLIAEQPLPYAFSCALEIPTDLQTRLALGEVILSSSATAVSATVWATQSFTITIDVDELLGEFAQINQMLQAENEATEKLELPMETVEPPVRSQVESDYLKLSFLSSEAEATAPRPSPFPFLAGQPLPPQIYRPDPAKADRKGLDLPQFRSVQDTVTAPSEAVASDEPKTPSTSSEEAISTAPAPSLEEDLAATSKDAAFGETVKTDTASFQVSLPRYPDAAIQPPLESVPAEREIPAFGSQNEGLAGRKPTPSIKALHEIQSLSSEAIAFRSLKLQERFWLRLNSLASDVELSEWLRNNLHAAGIPLPTRWNPSTHSSVARSPSEELTTQEFVVDDEPFPPSHNHRSKFGRNDRSRPADSTEPSALTPEVSLPTPHLEVPADELISGEAVTVRVRLPRTTARTYIKLWINDCQTRLLLDGPRLLTDFLPISSGELEATAQLTVPYGSLEIRFEAIALDIQTQRESHKTTVTRRVIPPGLPNSSMDEFEP
jgi:hypothetical protein